MTDRIEALKAERDELIAANASATSWGAALGARQERINEIEREIRRIEVPADDEALADMRAEIERLTRERDDALDRIENAAQAMSETQPSWEWRAHAVVQALGFDYGGATPDLPEENSWHARNLRRAEARASAAEAEAARLRDACHHVSLIEQDSSTPAHIKVREVARYARAALAALREAGALK